MRKNRIRSVLYYGFVFALLMTSITPVKAIQIMENETTPEVSAYSFVAAQGDEVIELSGEYVETLVIAKNTTIVLTGNTKINTTSGNAIKVENDITLTIALNGFQLDVTTSATSMAGILLPKSATLIVKEGEKSTTGVFNVHGGPGTAPTAGTAGRDANNYYHGGTGGIGGNGGAAPGAGIGGDGSTGGAGSSNPGSGSDTTNNHSSISGTNGGVGGSSEPSSQPYCGDVYMFGNFQVNVLAGTHIESIGLVSASGGSMKEYPYDNHYMRASGGSAGGNGGTGYGSAGIGGGGIGGAGGGAGGGGTSTQREPKLSAPYAGAGGGGGGAGQTGGLGGSGSYGDRTKAPSGETGGTHNGGNGGVGQKNPENYDNTAGSGGAGGNVGNLIGQGELGFLYMDATINAIIKNSENSTTNSESNNQLKNKIYLLSECTIEVDDSNIIFDGTPQHPDVIIKDKNGIQIDSVKGVNYKLTYTNEVDAGVKKAQIKIESNGVPSDPNYLLVDGGFYTVNFTIKPNEDPFTISKSSDVFEYTYGESFSAAISGKNTYNNGQIEWTSEIDDTHQATITAASLISTDIIPTKIGKLKLKAIIRQTDKNANGVYNFPEVMSATYEKDIKINPKNIDDQSISVPSSIGPYTYIGGQIKPTFSTGAYKSGAIEFKTNKDTAHTELVEGRDFELVYGNNTNVSDGGTVTIKGIGNYNNEKYPITFSIEQRSINDASVKVTVVNPTYTGNELKATPVIEIYDKEFNTNHTLPISDYTLGWSSKKTDGTFTGNDFVNVGEKEITITGSGNIGGERKQNYKIVQADIGTIDLGIERAKDVYFTGDEIESRPTIKYYDILLTENGTTTVDPSEDVPNSDDYEISFSNHQLAGETTTTLTGINNFKGTKVLVGSENQGYDVLRRPLYILPDANQWKYYGAKDIFGENQNELNPVYRIFTRNLNTSATAEMKDPDLEKDANNRNYINDNIPIAGYPIALEGELSREGANNQLLDQRDTTYKYIINTLKLNDLTKANYEVRLVNNESSYSVKKYTYDGTPAEITGTLGKNDWYVKSPIVFNAPTNYTISKSGELDSSKNTWYPTITFDDGDYSKQGINYFLRYNNSKNANDPANGAISTGIGHNFKQDTVFPTGSLTITNDAWTAFNANADFNYFLNNDAVGFILAKDEMSKVNTKHYYISDNKLGKDELDKVKIPTIGASGSDLLSGINPFVSMDGDEWINESQFTLKIDELNTKRKYVYVRIEDFAGNVTYLNSDGIVFDKDAPILKAQYKQDSQWTTSNDVKITGEVYDENAGLKDRYVAYQMDNGPLQIIEGIQDGKFSITNLVDGNYTLIISAWDNANNEAAPISFKVMKDTVKPRILMNANTTTIATKQNITFDARVGASGVAKLEVSYNGGEFKEVKEGVQTPYTVTKNGIYTFRITNGAGVVSKESSIEFTKIDTATPKIEVSVTDLAHNKIENNSYTNSNVILTFANVEKNLGDGKFEYSIDNKATWTGVDENLDNEAIATLALAEGNYTVYVRVTAQNGLSSEAKFHFGIDRTKPKISIATKDANNSLWNSILDIFRKERQIVEANTVDEGASPSGVDYVQYYVVEGKATQSTLPSEDKAIEKMVKDSWTTGNKCEVEKGSAYVVYFKVVDKAGNITYGRSDRITIDDAIPEIETTYKRDGKWDSNPTIEVYAFDASPGIDSVSYQVDNETSISASEMFTIENLGLSDGNHTVTIVAKDKSGNIATKTVNVKIDTGKPTITADVASTTATSVNIDVKAQYSGLSGLDKVMVSKNGQGFEDITDLVASENPYVALENGTYRFRAVSGAGEYAETSITINEFIASESDLEAVVSAKTEDDKAYESGTWTNQNVTIKFSNELANLNGLSYQLRKDDGNWNTVNANEGYLTIEVTEGTHKYDFKVIYDNNQKESNVASIEVKIDKDAPTAKMKVAIDTWEGNQYVDNGFIYDTYYNERKVASIEASDTQSDIKSYYIFAIKEENIPTNIKGQTTASKIETLGKDRWLDGLSTFLNPNDKYVVFGKVYDNAGNVTYVSSNGMVFDDINPSLESDINQTDWYKDDTTLIHFNTEDNLSDVQRVEFSINNVKQLATLMYGEFTIETSQLAEGTNTIKVEVFDYAGNKNTSNFTAKKDTQLPTIRVTQPDTSGKLVTKSLLNVDVNGSSSGVAKIEVKIPDAGGWVDITDSYQNGYIAQEKGMYYFRVVNKAGNSATTSINLNNISKDIPIIDYIMTKSDGSDYFEDNWSKENVQVRFTNENANQIVAKYMYKVDDGSYIELKEELDNSAIFTSQEGAHKYTMKVILDNGLESEEVSITIKVDAIAPQIRVNSDLSKWVKEEQELEVEVIDLESGVNSKGYSFDNGYTWQEDNKMMITANKVVGLKAKDSVDNIASEKTEIQKIDSQGPTVQKFKQIGSQEAKVRDLEATIVDYKDLTQKEGSGIATVYAMTTYPYKDGKLNPNPDKTYDMRYVNGKWVSEKAISVPYNGTNDVWLVTEDNVGNQKIYSTQVTNMIGDGDDEGNTERPKPGEPTNPDTPKPENPKDPNKPLKPNQPSNSGNNGGSNTNQSGSGSNNTNQTNGAIKDVTVYDDKQISNSSKNETNTTTKNYANELSKTKDTMDALKDIETSLSKDSKVSSVKIIYIVLWILLVIVVVWGALLWYRYRKLKNTLETEQNDSLTNESEGK